MSDYTPNERRMKIIYVADAVGPHDDDEAAVEAGDEFDRFIAKVKADALREAAAGFIDWDALRGDVQVTPEIEELHKSADYLMREADRIEGEA